MRPNEPTLSLPPPQTPDGAAAALAALAETLLQGGYRFITPTPLTHATVNARPGAAVARTLPDVFGWSRPFHPDLLPDGMLRLMERADVVRHEGDLLKSAVRFSTLGDLLIAHSAFPTVDRDAVFFGPDTYKFVDALRASFATLPRAPRRAVDLCTGAGPAGLVTAAAYPDCDVAMVDINERALFVAATNAAVAGLTNARACRSDLLADLDGTFDLVTAHPPYLLDDGERTYRHGGGSFGERLALRIVDEALERLSAHGRLLLFTGSAISDGGDGLRDQVEERLRGRDDLAWSYREADPDVFGEELARPAYERADRIALVVLTITRAR